MGSVLPKVRLDPTTSWHLSGLLLIKCMLIQVTGDLLMHQLYFRLSDPTSMSATLLFHNFVTSPRMPGAHSSPCCPAVKAPEATWVISLLCLEAVLAAHCSSSACLSSSHLFFLSHSCPRTALPFPSLFCFLFLLPSGPDSTYCAARSLLSSRSGFHTWSVAPSGTLHEHIPSTSLGTCRTPEYAPFGTDFFGIS